MPSTRRCVFGCDTTGVTIHRFPNPEKFPENFKAWVNLAGDRLGGLSDEQTFKNKRVCDRHFLEEHKNRNNRLNALALPSLHLSRPSSNTEGGVNVQSGVLFTLHELSGPSTSYAEGSVDVQSDVPFTLQEQSEPSTSYAEGSVNVQPDVPFTLQDQSGPSTSYAEDSVNVQSDVPFTLQEQTGASSMVRENILLVTASTSSSKKSINSAGARKNIATYYRSTQKQIKKMRSEICRLRRRNTNFKTRLSNAEKISTKISLEKVTKPMTLPANILTRLQFRETSKKPKGRRFTMEEKMLSLSLFKRSPKCYALLAKCFTLPSSKCLKTVVSKIKIGPGINQIIFAEIEKSVNLMAEDERICTLIFDEMSINPQVHYNAAYDQLKGFTTIGDLRIADHVLVFMLYGVKTRYKLPVAYYFTNSLNKYNLKTAIKEIVHFVKPTGLKIIATVCDQSTVNIGAIGSLVTEAKETCLKNRKVWTHDQIIIENQTIIPLYDVPHIFKCIRNNMLTKHLKYIDCDTKTEKVIKWDYIRNIYEADKTYGELKLLPKITEEHVDPQKINKMKVKSATQIFSHSVAATTRRLVDSGKVPQECANLIQFVLILDKLFDSLNSSTFVPLNGKIYRAGVKTNSPHHELWQTAKQFLKNIKFIESKKDGNKIRLVEKEVPCIRNLVKTIEGLQAIWKCLHNRYGYDIMLCRNFNQDPIENFFGRIRGVGLRNVSPNTVAFEGAFKSLLLSKFTSTHSFNSNCEDDKSTFLISLDFFLKESEKQNLNPNKTQQDILPEEININEEILLNNENISEGSDTKHYVCGWVLRKCLQKLKNLKKCDKCKEKLFSTSRNPYLTAKEYQNSKWLLYPSNEAVECFHEVQNITTGTLCKNVPTNNLKTTIKKFIAIFVDFSKVFDCDEHKEEIIKLFEDISINVIIYSWCRSINRILSGRINYDGVDEIKNFAKTYFNKHKHNKNKK